MLSQSQELVFTPDEEKLFNKMGKALSRKGQVILYGPPGTGKTYAALRYIEWKYPRKLNSTNQRIWMMIANNQIFSWDSILYDSKVQEWDIGQIPRNFREARLGDKVLCYQTTDGNNRGFVGIAEISREYDESSKKLEVRGVYPFRKAISYDEFKNRPEYKQTQAGRTRNRGRMFSLTEEFVNWIREWLEDNGDDKGADLLSASKQPNVEMVTFHPSFSYEDFIEGYKPIAGEDGKISFQLQPGVFYRLCERALKNEDQDHFLIIDEINRGNVSKIFGEMITLLEQDKRGTEIVLPQSKEVFSIPKNVKIIATMNTADHSIKIMDTALKRRFAFIERMPDYSLIDVEIDNLGLSIAGILKQLNKRLMDFQGRDKQIGHAYFMKNGKPIPSLGEFMEVYEMDIIPLIQEYCFNDYQQLAEVVGHDFVDPDRMEIRTVVFNDQYSFVTAIRNHFGKG